MIQRMMMLAGVLALSTGPVLIAQALAQTTTVTAATSAMPAPTFVSVQPVGEILGRVFTGALVKNAAGETVGNVNDVVFNSSGQISTVILGVGGFLGMGEKNVGVPFSSLKIETGKDGARLITALLSKDSLINAAPFTATEKTTYESVKDKASELGAKASEKAGELKDQAVKKVDEMRK